MLIRRRDLLRGLESEVSKVESKVSSKQLCRHLPDSLSCTRGCLLSGCWLSACHLSLVLVLFGSSVFVRSSVLVSVLFLSVRCPG